MENLMEFINQYWGVSLVGGITVGGIITFAIVQVKYLLREHAKNATINALMEGITTVIGQKDKKALDWAEEKSALIAENQYYKASTAVMFKAISYLVAASKLPIEEKLALQADFIHLKDMTLEQLKPVAEDTLTDVKADLKETADEQAPLVTTIITNAVNTATTLLEKYTKKEGE
jgi:hypothetical protein